MVHKKSEIHFVPPRHDLWGHKEELVTLDVAKLDKAWRYNRVDEGGGSNPDAIFRYEGVKRWIGSSQEVELWATTVTKEDDEADALCFVEGRHSFAVLRDLGYTSVEAWVTRDEADEIVRKYGPENYVPPS